MNEKNTATKHKIPQSKNQHFCMEIAARLDRISDRACAMAKLQILQIITNTEYPPTNEQFSHESFPSYYGDQ